MKYKFDQASISCSKTITQSYTTSFYFGTMMLDKSIRGPIFAIYGMVRAADEIVDSFIDYNQELLLSSFKNDTYRAIKDGISLNPILHSFQNVVNTYIIDHELIDQFFHSMEMDLNPITYDKESYEKYILGSAEVVGLMCLKVFCKGNENQYQELRPYAMKLGSAFQKINFLRDLKDDNDLLGRNYFPDLDYARFNNETKSSIEKEIKSEFDEALTGIRKLPTSAKLGVYIAYLYYRYLLIKIEGSSAYHLKSRRIRISNIRKIYLLFKARLQLGLKMI